MPIARFQMPDGRVARFEVPDGTSPEQAQSMIAKAMGPQSKPMDPTEGNSFLDNAVAATGKGMTSVARALGASPDFLRRNGLPGTKEEADAQDAPLMKTAGGKVGNVVGQAAPAAVGMLIPGANTYLGAGLIGGATGAAFTEGGADERIRGAVGGALGGLGGKAAGDALGYAVPKLAQRMATNRATAQVANAQRDAAAVAAKDAGYVLPPADVNPSLLNEALGGLSGKIKTAQAASARNQGTTNALARKALGMADDMPLNADTLQSFRNTAATSGYAPIRQAGEISADASYGKALDAIAGQYQGAARSFPGAAKNPVMDMVESLRQQKFDAGDALDMVKVLRESADKAYRSGDSGLGKASKAAAGALEDQIERHLKASGDDAAMAAFRKARQDIAKSYSVQKAVNPGSGDVSAQALARELQKGKPLSGDLKTIAEVGNAFPKATQALKESPKAVSPLDFAFGGGAGLATGNPLALATMAARPTARSLLLSKAYQGLLANPKSYSPGLLESALPALDNELVRRTLPGAGGLLGIQLSQ
jgi:hypothetical protein